ncbi:putative Cytochrome P450 [Hibiscus syriacus]|uniref:Cytochrome P450 n=1 Tax=Hibiscus syriacus TaxID=106335 RepID=A0A6A3CLD5_HIBSY|nr:putative Cytochrome P450 [Hibiscus syriacus]
MDYFHSLTATSTVAIIGFPLLFLLSFLWISKALSRNTNQKKTAPEAGGAWPIIGHLRLLGGPQPPHISLANIAEKSGRIFTIKLGVHRALVVSSWEIAKECLTINDKAFATRPKLASMELLGYNNAMIAFAPYGPYWRQVRKFATIELLSNHRLDSLKHVRESEIKTSLQQLYLLWNNKRDPNTNEVSVEMNRWFKDVTLNVILRIIVGKRISYSNEGVEAVKWKKSLDDLIELSGKFVVSDALPYLRWLDIGGDEKFMKKTARELDQVVEGWLQEHREKKAANEANSEGDFMGVMLSILRDADEHDADTINKATSLALILAAEDTTSITMTWALSLFTQ